MPPAIRCPDCGLETMPGAPDCAALRDLLLARDFEQSALFWQHHRVAIDAYCVQHASYIKSAKSLAAHLCGLCVAFERGNSPDALRQLQAWLSTNPDIRKPALPTERGKLTIAHVSGIIDPVNTATRSVSGRNPPGTPIANCTLSRGNGCRCRRQQRKETRS